VGSEGEDGLVDAEGEGLRGEELGLRRLRQVRPQPVFSATRSNHQLIGFGDALERYVTDCDTVCRLRHVGALPTHNGFGGENRCVDY
jgi:hypothetical protein